MEYIVNYQFQPKNANRPNDKITRLDNIADERGFSALPSVGDYVRLLASPDHKHLTPMKGQVQSRLFTYENDTCLITIVLAETDIDWEQLAFFVHTNGS